MNSLISQGVITFFDIRDLIETFNNQNDDKILSLLDYLFKNYKSKQLREAHKPKIYSNENSTLDKNNIRDLLFDSLKKASNR